MAKKYSVNMENDEVVSVEVDGVRYDSPDQIAGAEDRDKILELISKSSGEDFDKEFEAEFRELERQSAGAPKIIVSVFLAVGALMLVIGHDRPAIS
jgi:hypothetical protein